MFYITYPETFLILCPEFKAYLILNMNQLRSSVGQISRQLSALCLSPGFKSSTDQTVQSVETENDHEDPLFGFPAMDLETFEAFNNKLKNKIFASSLVKISHTSVS